MKMERQDLGHYQVLYPLEEAPGFLVARNTYTDQKVLIRLLDSPDEEDQIQKIVEQARRLPPSHHPGLLHILAVEQLNGSSYVIFECPEGKTLASRMLEQKLSFSEILDVGAQLADCLDLLHYDGFAGPDFDPSMIFLSGSAVKLLYLNPGNDTKIDPYTDIGSLGSLLFQLASGSNEPGASSESSMKSDFQRAFQVILKFAQETDPSCRYSSASDMAYALRRLKVAGLHNVKLTEEEFTSGLAPPVDQIKSEPASEIIQPKGNHYVIPALLIVIVLAGALLYFLFPAESRLFAVLPFATLKNGNALPLSAWSASFTEDLTESISESAMVPVISPESAFYYSKTQLPQEEIAKKLGAGTFITGTVTATDGNNLIVNVNLMKGSRKSPLWQDSYSFNRYQAGPVLQSISESVAAALHVENPAIHHNFPEGINPHAADLYWEGRERMQIRTPENIRIALNRFQQAVKIEPQFAQAQAADATCWLLLSLWDPDSEYNRSTARKAALRALEIKSQSAFPHVSLGILSLLYERNLPSAENEFRRAIEINSGEPFARIYRSMLLTVLNRPGEALEDIHRALEIDPFSADINLTGAFILLQLRKFNEATEITRLLAERSPSSRIYLLMGDSYHGRSLTDEAMRAYKLAKDLGSVEAEIRTAGVMASAGLHIEALSLLQKLETNPSVSAYDLARSYALVPDQANALKWLRQSYQRNESSLLFLKTDFAFDTIRSDPAFAEIVKQCGL